MYEIVYKREREVKNMGEAKRRGTFEERKAEAIQRYKETEAKQNARRMVHELRTKKH